MLVLGSSADQVIYVGIGDIFLVDIEFDDSQVRTQGDIDSPVCNGIPQTQQSCKNLKKKNIIIIRITRILFPFLVLQYLVVGFEGIGCESRHAILDDRDEELGSLFRIPAQMADYL